MLMRLNLDKVTHPIHCYYPASGQKYFDRLRHGTIYHETINVVEHPVHESGVVVNDEHFKIEAAFLEHGIDNIGWRITEPDTRKFDEEKLSSFGVKGRMVRELKENGKIDVNGQTITLDDVSWVRKGDTLAMVIDTRKCPQAIELARGAKTLICESTYLDEHKHLARDHYHMTATEAAEIAKEAGVQHLILTHFSARYLDSSDFEREAKKVFPNTSAAEDLRKFPFPR